MFYEGKFKGAVDLERIEFKFVDQKVNVPNN